MIVVTFGPRTSTSLNLNNHCSWYLRSSVILRSIVTQNNAGLIYIAHASLKPRTISAVRCTVRGLSNGLPVIQNPAINILLTYNCLHYLWFAIYVWPQQAGHYSNGFIIVIIIIIKFLTIITAGSRWPMNSSTDHQLFVSYVKGPCNKDAVEANGYVWIICPKFMQCCSRACDM